MKQMLTGFIAVGLLAGVFAIGVAGAPFVNATLSASPSIAPTHSIPTAILAPTVTPTTITAQVASTAELNAAADRAAFLTTRYGVAATQVAQLTKSTYDVAKRLGLKQDTRTLLHQLVLDFAEHGGSQLRDFRIEGDDESVARKVGGHAAGLRALTAGQIVEIRTAMAIIGLEEYRLGK